MKVIDRSPKQDNLSILEKVTARIRKVMEYGLSWDSDIEAQEVIITQLGKTLSNKYFLLRNIALEGLDIPISLILVGPPGLFVMYASALKGVYRAKSETWAEMNSRTRKFEPARPNLIARTLLMTRAVEAFLTRHSQRPLELQSVLFFSNPGTHVDVIRPAIRIVLMDGLERFISSLTQTRTFLKNEEIQVIVETLTRPPAAPEGAEAHLPAGSSPDHLRTSLGKASAAPDKITRRYESFSSRFKLTTPQWIILGVVGMLEILLLVGFIIYIILTP
jgi:hypothetical protein